MVETVAKYQRVLLIELIVDAWVNSDTTLRRHRSGGKRIDHSQRLWIECNCIDDETVVDCIPPHVQKEGSSFDDRPTYTSTKLVQREWRFQLSKRVARVPELVGKVVGDGAAELAGTRFGKDLNAAKSQLVVLRREGVLINSDLAN